MLRLKNILSNVRRLSTSARVMHEELFVHRDTKDNNDKTPFDFTEANLTRIAALIQNYPEGAQRSVLCSALDLVQRQIGWIPISAMHKIAQMLSIPRSRVYEVATFFTMYKRHFRGKYHVRICGTTPCMIRGAEDIVTAAEEACCCTVGGLSPDGIFGIDIVECLGACVNAPVMIIEDDYYEDLNICDVYNIIQTIRCGAIPNVGPQNGRFASEPITGLTSLTTPPPGPGYCIQEALKKSPCAK